MAKEAMTEEEREARMMQLEHAKEMKALSMTWNEGRNARCHPRGEDTRPGQDVIEFDAGLSLQEEARRRPGRGRSFDSLNGGDKFNKDNNPEPDLFDIVEVFASKMR